MEETCYFTIDVIKTEFESKKALVILFGNVTDKVCQINYHKVLKEVEILKSAQVKE